jgi:hypothetical protein
LKQIRNMEKVFKTPKPLLGKVPADPFSKPLIGDHIARKQVAVTSPSRHLPNPEKPSVRILDVVAPF